MKLTFASKCVPSQFCLFVFQIYILFGLRLLLYMLIYLLVREVPFWGLIQNISERTHSLSTARGCVKHATKNSDKDKKSPSNFDCDVIPQCCLSLHIKVIEKLMVRSHSSYLHGDCVTLYKPNNAVWNCQTNHLRISGRLKTITHQLID